MSQSSSVPLEYRFVQTLWFGRTDRLPTYAVKAMLVIVPEGTHHGNRHVASDFPSLSDPPEIADDGRAGGLLLIAPGGQRQLADWHLSLPFLPVLLRDLLFILERRTLSALAWSKKPGSYPSGSGQ